MPQKITTFRFPDGVCIAQALPPQPAGVSMESPALQVMTDLTEVRAATIDPSATLALAERTMIHQGVRLLFVMTDMPCVDGIISLIDIQSEEALQQAQRLNLRRHELTVGDVMNKLSELDTVDYAELSRATVGQAVVTLESCGRPHLLVSEAATASAPPRIRGIISRTQVERQLGMSLPNNPMATTFAKLAKSLA
jgi:CBS domain-containing protein